MNELRRAIILARAAHHGQVCKVQRRLYVEHLERVAKLVNTNDVDAVTVAWLHDIAEDTIISIEDLQQIGFSERVVKAVKLLTKDETLSYAENIDRIIESGNRLALDVKIADVRDHLRQETIAVLPQRMKDKYIPALRRLLRAYR
jgi:(p)ppGpp synthase/HD superfamily hydrolase